MLLSRDKQFLFIHIPKTAGTSIRSTLMDYADHPEQLWENRLLALLGIHVNLVGPWHRRRFRPHCTARDVYRSLPRDVYDRLFKFAFVRNPWDLLVSLYNFIPGRPAHRYARRVARMTFAEFVEEWTRRPEIHQTRRLCSRDGRLLLDYVGYFEHLDHDFGVICDRIGVRAPLPRKNQSRHGDYRDLYTPALKNLVAERLAEDIEFLGYSFDGPQSTRCRELQNIERRAA